MPFLLLLFIALSGLAQAAPAPSPERLAQLKTEIGRLETSLGKTNRARDEATRDLRDLDQRIAALREHQEALRKQQQKNQARLTSLLADQRRLTAQRQQQQAVLGELVRRHYAQGEGSAVKFLLGQEDPEDVARLWQYRRYVEHSIGTRIQALNASLAELDAVSAQLTDTRTQLEQDGKALAQQQQDMQAAREQRRQLLARLDSQLGNDKKRLANLRADSARLESLLRGVQDAIRDIPVDLGNKPFANLATKLPWPLNGKLQIRYGTQISGNLRWDGVVLAARTGDAVRAIHPGRVIYADWLPGYGLMTIVDQGQGYMTLYGYNESLTRRVGDWVGTGDIIAHAGESGGHRAPGLYFGIRHNGKPVNPERWCNARVTLPAPR